MDWTEPQDGDRVSISLPDTFSAIRCTYVTRSCHSTFYEMTTRRPHNVTSRKERTLREQHRPVYVEGLRSSRPYAHGRETREEDRTAPLRLHRGTQMTLRGGLGFTTGISARICVNLPGTSRLAVYSTVFSVLGKGGSQEEELQDHNICFDTPALLQPHIIELMLMYRYASA